MYTSTVLIVSIVTIYFEVILRQSYPQQNKETVQMLMMTSVDILATATPFQS